MSVVASGLFIEVPRFVEVDNSIARQLENCQDNNLVLDKLMKIFYTWFNIETGEKHDTSN